MKNLSKLTIIILVSLSNVCFCSDAKKGDEFTALLPSGAQHMEVAQPQQLTLTKSQRQSFRIIMKSKLI